MDSLSITILFIALSATVGAFVAGRVRDRCLMDWSGDPVYVTFNDGKVVWGILRLESTGFELVYEKEYLDEKDAHIEKSFIVYKNEYSTIKQIVRYVKDLGEKSGKEREYFLRSRDYHKKLIRLKRNIRNFFATVKDSVMEVVNLFIGRAKASIPSARVLAGQDKYVSSIKDSTFSMLASSFEPLLEKHLGKHVILETEDNGKLVERRAILKDYTSQFIELMDLDVGSDDQQGSTRADIIVLRSTGVVRHLSA